MGVRRAVRWGFVVWMCGAWLGACGSSSSSVEPDGGVADAGARDAPGDATVDGPTDAGDTPDVTPPSVSAVVPQDDAAAVSIGATVRATFDEAIDPATLTDASFTLAIGGSAIPGTVGYDAATHAATFTPAAPLPYLAEVVATLSGDVADVAGNHLAAPYAWSFTTAKSPATVIAQTPIDRARLASTATAVTATFSEPIDPTTLTTASFTVSGVEPATGVVAGAVSYDAAMRRATFTPAAPLADGATYGATLAVTIADATGLPLATPVSWTFRTAVPPRKISTDLPIGAYQPTIVRNTAGDAMATWRAYDGSSFSLYSAATSTWSTPARLAAGSYGVQVVSNGTGFALAWSSDGTVYAATYAGGALSAPTSLGADGSYQSLALASNGSGYAVAWGGVKVAIYASGAWTTTTLATTSSTYLREPPRLASDGIGYAVTYGSLLGTLSAYVYAGGAWSAAAILSPAGTSGQLTAQLASTGAGYTVVWSRSTGTSPATGITEYTAGAWGAPLTLSTDAASSVAIAPRGGAYMAAWTVGVASANRGVYGASNESGAWPATPTKVWATTTQDTLIGLAPIDVGYALAFMDSVDVFATTYAAGAWATPARLSNLSIAGDAHLAGRGSDAALVWTVNAGEGLYTSKTYGAQWGPVSLVAGTSGLGELTLAAASSGYLAAWVTDGGTAIGWSRYVGAWVEGARLPGSTSLGGTTTAPVIATQPGGDAIAVWSQYVGRERPTVQASVRHAGTWQTPFTVAESPDPGVLYDALGVAAFGAGFVVTWSDDDQRVSARRYDPIAGWSAAGVVLSGVYGARIAASATSVRIVAGTYSDSNAASVNVVSATSSDGITWSAAAPVLVGKGTGTWVVSALASDGAGYAIMARKGTNSLSGYAAVFDGAAWVSTELGFTTSVALASSGPDSYMLVLNQSASGSTRYLSAMTWGAGSWSTSTAVSAGYASAGPSLAADGTGYLVSWSEGSGSAMTSYARAYAGGAWRAAVQRPRGDGPLAANGEIYALVELVDDGGTQRVASQATRADAWSTSGGAIEAEVGDALAVCLAADADHSFLTAWQRTRAEGAEIWASTGN